MCGFIQYKKPTTQTEKPSTGIKSLDSLIEISPGSVNCIYEDENTFIHNTLLQVFISSCVDRNEEYRVLSTEEKVLKRFDRHKQVSNTPNNTTDIRIAWRYNTFNMENKSSGWDMLNKIDIPSDYILEDVSALLECMKTQKSMNFVIFSLFAPLYGSSKSENKILYDIREYARLNKHTVFLSIPKFLMSWDPSVFFDNILQVYSDLLFPGETSLYNCYVEILKFFNGEALRVNNLESYRYGVVLKAKEIRVESIDILPEETTATSGCSQF